MTIWDCQTHVRMTSMTSSVKRTDLDFKISVALIQTVQQITRTLIHKNQFTSLCRGQKPASKCIRLVYEILVICRALQALYTPQRCELMKTKTTNINCSYRIFIVCRSPVSPSCWARVRLSNNFLPKQSSCTQISR